MKKESVRMDCLRHERYPQKELGRFVLKDGAMVYDATGKLPGRGYYLHYEEKIRDLLAQPKFSSRLPGTLSEEELQKWERSF